MGEEKRHEMMETLFGAESEDSDDEVEPVRQVVSDQASDRSDKEGSYDGEDGDGDAEVEVDGEAESEGEKGESDAERGASDEEERAESDRESEGGRDVEIESEGEREEVEVSASGSERSHRAQPVEDYEDEEIEEVQEEVRGQSEGEEDEQQDDEPGQKFEVAEARDVFGESDEEEDQEAEQEPEQEVEDRRSPEESLQGSPERARSDDEGSEGDAARAEEVVGDEDRERSERSESDDERYIEQKPEKPMGPPIELQIPLRPPPGMPDHLNIVRTSNIMSIDMKPFDPKTYEAQEPFTTEVEGQKQHIRLEENVVRWRRVHNRDGSESIESNARFVKWSDGSMQLLLGGEVLDLSVQNAAQDQSHLFIRHPKVYPRIPLLSVVLLGYFSSFSWYVLGMFLYFSLF
ncbi:hypothetical protein KC19_2G123400 [Ceratodon purpureus]|uniref:RNA polymerase-associated protein LEO1 n=1 Tax=Ceratodon purpureus TaxID=3225 RepID=A0A8T0IVM4_CERPU|nr:hypothetical protein KC19_2G123400 [Ceratodon purpureus]